MAITVVNKKNFRGRCTYIGRGSVFGNPFHVSMGREACIAAYKERFDKLMSTDNAFSTAVNELVARAIAGEDLFLSCFCAPLPCHGDIIKAYIDQQIDILHHA